MLSRDLAGAPEMVAYLTILIRIELLTRPLDGKADKTRVLGTSEAGMLDNEQCPQIRTTKLVIIYLVFSRRGASLAANGKNEHGNIW